MESYANEEKRILSLIVQGTPSDKLYLEYKKLRDRINADFEELRLTSAFIEALANRYDIKPPSVPTVKHEPILPTIKNEYKQRIFDMAVKSMKDGVVDTQPVVEQLIKMGDNRPARNLRKAVGNILYQRHWKRVGSGKFSP